MRGRVPERNETRPKTEDFREELQARIRRAPRQSRPHIELNSGELHRTHRGPSSEGWRTRREHDALMLCDDVGQRDKSKAKVVFQTASGCAASLTIRCRVRRAGAPSDGAKSYAKPFAVAYGRVPP